MRCEGDLLLGRGRGRTGAALVRTLLFAGPSSAVHNYMHSSEIAPVQFLGPLYSAKLFGCPWPCDEELAVVQHKAERCGLDVDKTGF